MRTKTATPAKRTAPDPTAFKAHRIKHNTPTPFIGRCGNIVMFVEEILDTGTTAFVVLRGTLLEGRHFNDRGEYKQGDRVTIGPITNHWRRISIK